MGLISSSFVRILFLAKVTGHASSSWRKTGQRASRVAIWRTKCVFKIRDDIDVDLPTFMYVCRVFSSSCIGALLIVVNTFAKFDYRFVLSCPSLIRVSSESNQCILFVESGQVLQVVPPV